MSAAAAASLFAKCTPAIGTNINECGGLTKCQISTATPAILEEIFKEGSQYRDMQSLIATQFEIKSCGARTNGLYDFLMANKKMMRDRMVKIPTGVGTTTIEPFIMADQKSVIKDEYWTVARLYNSGGTYTIDVRSRNNVPLDVSWFVRLMKVFVFSKTAGGTILRGAFKVTSAVATTFGGNNVIEITATAENANTLGSTTKSDFSGFTVGAPLSAAFLVKGTPNVSDVERWCENRPGLNPNKNVPFWWQTSRWTMCTDQLYEEAYRQLKAHNAFFNRFGDIDSAKRNKQYGERFQREWLNDFFWGKPLPNQTVSAYRSLDQISSVATATYGLYTPTEGKCVGRRANSVGVYEQLAECGYVRDLQGQRLNLQELFNELYDVWRARGDQGIPNDVIELYTDSKTAAQIQRGMILYFNNLASGLARFNIDAKKSQFGLDGPLGFTYDEYALDYPRTKIRIVTHFYFDDFAAAATAEGIPTAGTQILIPDWTTIYPMHIASNRKVHRTGAIEDMAKIDGEFACVMENPTQEVSLNSVSWGTVVECPANSRLLEGFRNDVVPDAGGTSGNIYDLYSVYP